MELQIYSYDYSQVFSEPKNEGITFEGRSVAPKYFCIKGNGMQG